MTMASTKLTLGAMPQSGEKLRETLQQALEQTEQLDDFVQVVRDLAQYEFRHGMSSETFFARFEAGQLGDEIDSLRWANQYQIYRETKAELDQMVDLIEAYALPVMA
jgi:hypothetical protein